MINIAERSLCDIEEAIHLSEEYLGVDFFSVDCSVNIKDIYSQKQKILAHKEETMRQKSHVIWLKARDENLKYFHQFANHRRLSNSIWEASNGQGNMVYD